MTNNVDDLATYLQYQSLLFTSNAVNEASPGSAGALFTDTATSALSSSSASNVQVDGSRVGRSTRSISWLTPP